MIYYGIAYWKKVLTTVDLAKTDIYLNNTNKTSKQKKRGGAEKKKYISCLDQVSPNFFDLSFRPTLA